MNDASELVFVGLSGLQSVSCGFVFGVAIFAPGFEKAEVGVVLGLACDGVAIGEEKLEAGGVEVVVASGVDECGSLGLRGGGTLSAMREDFGG